MPPGTKKSAVRKASPRKNRGNAGKSAAVVGGAPDFSGDVGTHDYVIRMAEHVGSADIWLSNYDLEVKGILWRYGSDVEVPDLDPYVQIYRDSFGGSRGWPGRGCVAGILAMLRLPIKKLYFYGCTDLFHSDETGKHRWPVERAMLHDLAKQKGIKIIEA